MVTYYSQIFSATSNMLKAAFFDPLTIKVGFTH
jgi:hypothetical protein